MDLTEYDDLIRHLVAIAIKQDVTNRRLEEHHADIKALLQQQQASTAQQTLVNTQNTALINRISRTLDLIDEKLERLVPPP